MLRADRRDHQLCLKMMMFVRPILIFSSTSSKLRVYICPAPAKFIAAQMTLGRLQTECTGTVLITLQFRLIRVMPAFILVLFTTWIRVMPTMITKLLASNSFGMGKRRSLPKGHQRQFSNERPLANAVNPLSVQQSNLCLGTPTLKPKFNNLMSNCCNKCAKHAPLHHRHQRNDVSVVVFGSSEHRSLHCDTASEKPPRARSKVA